MAWNPRGSRSVPVDATHSLLPIDVGFDLRLHDMDIELPAGTTRVKYMDRRDWEQLAILPDDLSRLRAAGYRVKAGR